jgi:hypothetical protein
MVCGVCVGEYRGRREDGMLLVPVVVQVKFNGWQSKRPKSMYTSASLCAKSPCSFFPTPSSSGSAAVWWSRRLHSLGNVGTPSLHCDSPFPAIVSRQPHRQNGRFQLENPQHRCPRPGILIQLRPRDPNPRRPARLDTGCTDTFRPDQAIDASRSGGRSAQGSPREPAIWRRRARKGRPRQHLNRTH